MEKSTQQLLSDFINNRCSPSELLQVRQLIQQGVDEKMWHEALEEAKRLSSEASSAIELDETKLFSRIQHHLAPDPQKRSSVKWLAIAASLILVAGIYWLLPHTNLEQVAPALAKTNTLPASPVKTERQWIKLPDGSSVQLNSNSQLDYPENFGGQTREVTLRGEAFFDIKHNPSKPFIIHTGKLKTTVLGTAFNINAYSLNEAITITVTRGKVKVEDETKTLAILTPEQQLAWAPEKTEVLKEKVSAQAAVSWTKEDLILDDITLEEAAVLISERYNVKIQFNNERVKSCRFTAAFLNRNEIGQVLSVIGDITGAELQLKENIVTIDGKGC